MYKNLINECLIIYKETLGKYNDLGYKYFYCCLFLVLGFAIMRLLYETFIQVF